MSVPKKRNSSIKAVGVTSVREDPWLTAQNAASAVARNDLKQGRGDNQLLALLPNTLNTSGAAPCGELVSCLRTGGTGWLHGRPPDGTILLPALSSRGHQ
jgi:hypothetical protein